MWSNMTDPVSTIVTFILVALAAFVVINAILIATFSIIMRMNQKYFKKFFSDFNENRKDINTPRR